MAGHAERNPNRREFFKARGGQEAAPLAKMNLEFDRLRAEVKHYPPYIASIVASEFAEFVAKTIDEFASESLVA